MTYKIPKADILTLAIKEALREQKTVISQAKLTELVNLKLKKMDPEYAASEERVRRVTLMAKLAKVEIQTRELEDKSRNSPCPVCGKKRMRRIQNRTIFDGKVTLGYRCRSLRLPHRPKEERSDAIHFQCRGHRASICGSGQDRPCPDQALGFSQGLSTRLFRQGDHVRVRGVPRGGR